MSTFTAHVRGKAIIPDEPVDLPDGAEVTVTVVHVDRSVAAPASRVDPTLDPEAVRGIAADITQPWRPLNIELDPELGRAITEDPAFDIEES